MLHTKSRSTHKILGVLSLVAVSACSDPVEPYEFANQNLPAVEGADFVAPTLMAAGGFVAQDLGTLGGFGFNTATSINNNGQVVGTSALPSGARQAFIWTSGAGISSLGTTGGANSNAVDINEAGTVVGWSENAGAAKEAFVWNQGTGMTGLGLFGGIESRATHISNTGEISGRYTPVFNPMNPQGPQAFTWTPGGGFNPLGTLGGDLMTVANSVNENSVVVGNSFTSNDPTLPFKAFIRTGGALQNLGSLGPEFGEHNAFDINLQGQVVGAAIDTVTGLLVPFLWTQNSGFTNMVSLGFPANWIGAAWRINSLGYVVLLVIDPLRGNIPAVWLPGQGVVELPTLGGPNGQALDINETGDVVGWSMTPTGEIRPTLWKVDVPPDQAAQNILTGVQGIANTATNPKVVQKLDKAVRELGKSLSKLAQGDTTKAIKEMKDAAKQIQKAIDKGLNPGIGTGLLEALAQTGRELAVAAINDAIARGGDARDIGKAQTHLNKGDAKLAAGDYDGALKEYEKAAKDAQKA